MAKVQAQAAETSGVTLASISAAMRRQVETLRRPVMDVAGKLGAVRESVKDIAPKVMRLFAVIQAEYDNVSFVDFARMFDPSVPTSAADRDGVTGYRNHPTYYALTYMRRQSVQRPRGRQGVRDSATDALARSLATILQTIPADQVDQVWKAVQAEFAFTEAVMTRLRKRVGDTRPLFTLNVPRAGVVQVGKVIHMDRVAPAEPEELAQGGRRVKRAA